MKVSIIGGGGLVGSCAAYALQCGGVVSQIYLIDANADLAGGRRSTCSTAPRSWPTSASGRPGTTRSPRATSSCITAGLRRKPDESRLDLINRNVELFLSILGQVKAAGLKHDAIVLVVSNPVDVLTYLATTGLGLPSNQVLGLGTQLDTARFRSLIAESLKLPATQVTATILGEHGDSMVPIWSAAQAGGLPLEQFPGWTAVDGRRALRRTRGSGAEVIKLKGGAGFAVGLSIREVVHAVALDQKRILPVSSLVSGTYGIRDVCLSVPTVVGRGGVEAQLEIELWTEGAVGAPALGPGPARDDRPGPQDEPERLEGARRARRRRAPRRPPPTGAPSRVTMGSGGNGSRSGGSPRVTISGQGGGGRHG